MVEPSEPESILLVPVPKATPLVHQHRLCYDPAASANVPEHITLLYPFLVPDQLNDAVLATLRAFFNATSSFSFSLRSTAWFEQGVLYLTPDPAASFVDLTHRLSHAFGVLPYEGQYARVTPHLTIAHHGPSAALAQIAATLTGDLPIDAVAREAWVMVGHNETGWVLRHRFPFASN